MATQETLWNRIRKTVMEGVTTAAEKTEEFTNIGKAKLDVLAIKRKISKQFTELGGLVYEGVKTKTPENTFKTSEVKVIISHLAELEKELDEKEKKYNELKTAATS